MKGEFSMGNIHICDQQSRPYKRGDLPRGWSLKEGTTVLCPYLGESTIKGSLYVRMSTVHTYIQVLVWCIQFDYQLALPLGTLYGLATPANGGIRSGLSRLHFVHVGE